MREPSASFSSQPATAGLCALTVVIGVLLCVSRSPASACGRTPTIEEIQQHGITADNLPCTGDGNSAPPQRTGPSEAEGRRQLQRQFEKEMQEFNRKWDEDQQRLNRKVEEEIRQQKLRDEEAQRQRDLERREREAAYAILNQEGDRALDEMNKKLTTQGLNGLVQQQTPPANRLPEKNPFAKASRPAPQPNPFAKTTPSPNPFGGPGPSNIFAGGQSLGCNLSTQEIAGCINVPGSRGRTLNVSSTGASSAQPGQGAKRTQPQPPGYKASPSDYISAAQQVLSALQSQGPAGSASPSPCPPPQPDAADGSSALFPTPCNGADYGSQQQVPGWETSASGIRSLPVGPPSKTNCSRLLAYMTKVGDQIHGFPSKLAATIKAAGGAGCAVPTLGTCLRARLSGESPPPGCPSHDVDIADDGNDLVEKGSTNSNTTADVAKDAPGTGDCDEGPEHPEFGATNEKIHEWEACKRQDRHKALLKKLINEPDPYCQLIAGQILEHGMSSTGGELTPGRGDSASPVAERCRESADAARKLFADSHKPQLELHAN